MENIQERIADIGEYFQMFNVATLNDGASKGVYAYIIAQFPVSWSKTIPVDLIKDELCVTVQRKDNGYYFIGLLSNGVDKVFDAVDTVIKFNKSIEEKDELFNKKIDELKQLFMTEPLEKLKTLEFMFMPSTNRRAKTKKKEVEPVVEEPATEIATTVEPNDSEKAEVDNPTKKTPTDDAENNSLMNLAMGMVGE